MNSSQNEAGAIHISPILQIKESNQESGTPNTTHKMDSSLGSESAGGFPELIQESNHLPSAITWPDKGNLRGL